MCSSRSLVLSLLVGAAVAMAGCSSSPMSRIDADRATYESWPLDIQQAVLEGRVISGMTHEQVAMTLGEPSQKTTRSGRKGSEEVWVYGGGSRSSMPAVSLGTMIGGVGVQGSPNSGGGGGDYFEIVFVEGRVTRGTNP